MSDAHKVTLAHTGCLAASAFTGALPAALAAAAAAACLASGVSAPYFAPLVLAEVTVF